jgi:hypothetical protein
MDDAEEEKRTNADRRPATERNKGVANRQDRLVVQL